MKTVLFVIMIFGVGYYSGKHNVTFKTVHKMALKTTDAVQENVERIVK